MGTRQGGFGTVPTKNTNTISFPIEFPNSFYGVIPAVRGVLKGSDYYTISTPLTIYTFTKSSFDYAHYDYYGTTFNWIAIGT